MARPTVRPKTLNLLENALRSVWQELVCRELNTTELNDLFLTNTNISTDVQDRLKSIEIQEDCKVFRPVYYLDFRKSIHPSCANFSLPRIRSIKSEVPVFPAYYMDWECSGPCTAEYTPRVRNYELLQRTNDCKNGTEEWIYIEAGRSHPLTGARNCKRVRSY